MKLKGKASLYGNGEKVEPNTAANIQFCPETMECALPIFSCYHLGIKVRAGKPKYFSVIRVTYKHPVHGELLVHVRHTDFGPNIKYQTLIKDGGALKKIEDIRIIDLTRRAFRNLTGNLDLGVVDVEIERVE